MLKFFLLDCPTHKIKHLEDQLYNATSIYDEINAPTVLAQLGLFQPITLLLVSIASGERIFSSVKTLLRSLMTKQKSKIYQF